MSDVYFSAKFNGFYLAALKETYESSANGWPDDAINISTADYEALFAGQATGKLIAIGGDGKPVLRDPPAPTKAQLIADAKAQQATLLAKAAEAIAPLQDAVDVDDAIQAELDRLKAWKQFRVALNRLDVALAPDIVWPEEPGNVA